MLYLNQTKIYKYNLQQRTKLNFQKPVSPVFIECLVHVELHRT